MDQDKKQNYYQDTCSGEDQPVEETPPSPQRPISKEIEEAGTGLEPPPQSPHEKTPSPEAPIQIIEPPVPSRPPPQQRPQSTLVVGSSSTLPSSSKRPISENIDPQNGSTGEDLIYDRLPVTLPRPPKLPTVSILLESPVVIEETRQEEMTDKAKEKEKEAGKDVNPDQNDDDDLPNDHKILTIISMVLCSLILNIFAFVCLIPAYYYSTKSKESSQNRDFEEGIKYAKRSLILNLITVISTFLVILALFIIVQIILAATVY